MSAVAEREAQELVRGTLGVLCDRLGVTGVFDDEFDALATVLAQEIDMWVSAAAVMSDWAGPIGVES